MLQAASPEVYFEAVAARRGTNCAAERLPYIDRLVCQVDSSVNQEKYGDIFSYKSTIASILPVFIYAGLPFCLICPIKHAPVSLCCYSIFLNVVLLWYLFHSAYPCC